MAERYAYYKGLVEANGGQCQGTTLLGLRGISPDGVRHDSAENTGPYNDTFVLLSPAAEPSGQPTVKEFLGSTHAGQKASSISPNGVAQIRPGSYTTVPNGPFHDMPSWHVVRLNASGPVTPVVEHPTSSPDEGEAHGNGPAPESPDDPGNIPCWRDINKDGYLQASEKRAAEQKGVFATEILIHNGVNLDHGRSIGCQTLPPKTMTALIALVGENNSFGYTLVDANLPTPEAPPSPSVRS